MNRLIVAFAAALGLALVAPAGAQTVPIGTPPAPGRPTANLVLDAMLATARAASVNPSAAQAASVNSSAAIQRYNMGDYAGARSAAIQALIEANRLPYTQNPVLQSTIPQTSALQTNPFPLAGGTVAAVDASAFVAQARGAVAACASRNSANTSAAQAQLAAAQRDDKAGKYNNVRAEASAAVNLCAASQAQINARP
ncbi:MAG TPA: hypothetical protein VHT53_13175 [Candidatus Elarobacter sp.]|jgi:hypothetical protein|nr:hypothetical protein [Candidatus Elarobacter sp.]